MHRVFGFNAIGMDRNALRKKFGSPSMHETPPDETDVNILRYELDDRDMTLAMYLRRSRGKREAVVYQMELYTGKIDSNRHDSGHDSANDDLPNDTTNYDMPNDLPGDDIPDDVPGDLPDLPEEEPAPQKLTVLRAGSSHNP